MVLVKPRVHSAAQITSGVPFHSSYFTTTPHISRFGVPFQTEADHEVRDYWDKAYCWSGVVHVKSFIACSNSLDIASGKGNGDAAAEQQGRTLEKTASTAKSNHIMILA